VPTSATLTATGTLNAGAVTVSEWYTPASATLGYTVTGVAPNDNSSIRGFNLVGNPYACSIDWDQYSTTVATNGIYAPLVGGAVGVGNVIYILDPKSKNYNVYRAGNGGIGTIAATNSNIIPSGQGFFVQANQAGASLTFNETAKAPLLQATGANLFLGKPVQAAESQRLCLQLVKDSVIQDGTLISFESNANAGNILGEDAKYVPGNGPASLSTMSADNVALAINTLPLPKTSQEIPLNVHSSVNGVYELNLTTIKSVPILYDIWLKDAFKKDSIDMRSNPVYSFNNNLLEAGTISAGRFKLVIRQNPERAVRLLSFTATKASGGAQIVWTTENEENYTYFTVERSIDNGKTFDVNGSVTSGGLGTYSLLDKAPVNHAANQYRLKLEDLNGAISYSAVVTLTYGDVIAAKSSISIYPNPAKTNIYLTITPLFNSNTAATHNVYSVKIVNNIGTVMKTATATEQTWRLDVSAFMPGTYFVQVINNTDKTEVGRGSYVKL
jgi:trimeric autotransporter adhesin